MKQILFAIFSVFLSLHNVSAQTKKPQLYLDVHSIPSVKYNDVANAHAKDLAIQDKHGVKFLNYWVDEANGVVYCLASATDSASIVNAHKEAHGLLPQEMHAVTEGTAAMPKQGLNYFLDVHVIGAGKVTAADVVKVHQKDVAVQSKHGVNFINYWVDEKKGVVYCLSQAADSSNVMNTHKEAHGLMPNTIVSVKQGQ